MRLYLPFIVVILALFEKVSIASPAGTPYGPAMIGVTPVIADKSTLDLARLAEMEERIRVLQWQVVALSAALIALLVLLGLRQFYKKRRMHILSMTDELTKLPNRKHILTFLGDQAKMAYEEEQPISVIVFDIDHFKAVKDKYGHNGGDIALKTVANIGNQALRRGDRVGRIGGEEFLVVLPGTEHRSAMEIAERLRRSVEVTEFDKLLSGLHLTISLGVGEWKAGHESIDALVKRTGLALDEAKNNGCNRVVEK